MLSQRVLFRRCTSIHVAAILRPLRSAVVRVLELALMSTRLVASGALRTAGLIRRRGLPAGKTGVLREGCARLTWGMRGSLGLGGVLPLAGVACLHAEGSCRAAGWQSSSCRGCIALGQPADGFAALREANKISQYDDKIIYTTATTPKKSQ